MNLQPTLLLTLLILGGVPCCFAQTATDVARETKRLETEVNISVPASEAEAKALKDAGQIVINVQADGTLVINKTEMKLAELEKKLTTAASVNLKQAIVVRSDKATAYEHVFNVLDTCRKVGLYHVSFASQNPAGTKAASP